VCHIHYPALTRIIESTAEEFGMQHQEKRTIAGAYLAHLKMLKILGRVDNPFVINAEETSPFSVRKVLNS
jgi:linoleoyl-CoA desaturase